MSDNSDNESYASSMEPQEPVECILGKYKNKTFDSVRSYWEYVAATDNLNMIEFFAKFQYHGYIRVVNYLRTKKAELKGKFPTTEELYKLYDSEILTNNVYLSKPVLEADPFIIMASDLDDAGMDDGDMPSMTSEDVKKLESKGEGREQVLEKLLQATIISDNKKNEGKLKKRIEKPEGKGFKSERDTDYFEGYGDLSIHVEMLSDFVRTDTYRRGIMAAGIKDKIVMDVGAGTGILSMFAVQAGAKHVYSIEPSAVASDMQEIINDNGYADKITIIRKMSEDLTLEDFDGNKPDFIVSEWMGYFLYFEGMLPSVIKARQMFGDTAKMLPSNGTLRLSLLTDEKYYDEGVTRWGDKTKNPWGLKFAPLARYGNSTVGIEVFEEKELTGNVDIHTLDYNTAKPDDVDFESKFTFDLSHLQHMPTPMKIYGVVGHFSTDFGPNITLDTAPGATPTHWKQAVFMFKTPLTHDCKKNPELFTRLDCKRLENGRDLEVILQFPDKNNFTERFMLD